MKLFRIALLTVLFFCFAGIVDAVNPGDNLFPSDTLFPGDTSANFSASVLSGTAPLTVQFNDTTLIQSTSWSWDFNNDGISDSTQQNPVHTYTTPGIYTVNLTVTNEYGTFSTLKTDYISVSPGAPVTDTPAPYSATKTNNANSTASTFALIEMLVMTIGMCMIIGGLTGKISMKTVITYVIFVVLVVILLQLGASMASMLP